MSATELGLAVSVFLACAVEAVEALTIVLAVGTTRSWSSALWGVGAAVGVLAVIVAALGPALTALPIDVLRVGVGGLLLVFGLQWLRKAVLRAAGLKALHDEEATFAERAPRRPAAAGARPADRLDGYSFAISFKGVLLEGLEVAFIVAHVRRQPAPRRARRGRRGGRGRARGRSPGWPRTAPLARVPENTMKFSVGVMLTSFGMFWGAEGAGASWPGGDAALLAIVPAVLAAALAMAAWLRPARR